MKQLFSIVNVMLIAMLLAFGATTAVSVMSAQPFELVASDMFVPATVVAYIGIEIASLSMPTGILGVNVYADTVLQAARAFIKDESNRKFELRPNLTRIIDAFTKDREFTIPGLSEIRKAKTQATTALYLRAKDFTINSSKSCAPAGEQSGSANVAISFNEKGFTIKTNHKQHHGNEVSLQRAFANDLFNAEKTFWENLDQTLLTHLETNKSGVNNGGGAGTNFDAVNDIMAIDNSKEKFFYNIVMAQLQQNNYSPEFLEVHDTFWTAAQRQYINQGAGNSENTAFQFAGFQFFPSNLISPGVIGNNTYDSIHFMIPTGGVAILDWNDPLNIEGAVTGEKSWSTFQSLFRPEFTFDLFRTSSCADSSSDGGNTQDWVETWEFTLTFALATQPVPDANDTPIFKYGVMDDDTFSS